MSKQEYPGIGNRQLTDVKPEQKTSYRGMAHFAGSCTQNRTLYCASCTYFNGQRKKKGAMGICMLYKTMTKDRVDRRFPNHADACKYYQQIKRRS